MPVMPNQSTLHCELVTFVFGDCQALGCGNAGAAATMASTAAAALSQSCTTAPSRCSPCHVAYYILGEV